MFGRIIKGIGGFYYVKCSEGVLQCRARGLFRKKGHTPSVGDFVEIRIPDTGDALISSIEERKNHFIRPPVSNVDVIVAVASVRDPETDFYTFDKVLVTAEKNDVDVIVCVNKTDKGTKEDIDLFRSIYEGIYPLVFINAASGEGVDDLKKLLKGKDSALAGASGVGKSTLTNRLLPQAGVETGSISDRTGKGKHTTRHVELFETDEGFSVFDTPGFTSFEDPDISEKELDTFYPEIEKYSGGCRYSDCSHISEPECEVRKAVGEGLIHSSRYGSYKRQFEHLLEIRKYRK